MYDNIEKANQESKEPIRDLRQSGRQKEESAIKEP